jgi:hypothetical protein
MRITRATIVGIVAGLLVLGAFAGFAIGLPKVVKTDLPALPDRLDSKFVAISAATPADLGSTSAQGAAQAQQVAANAKTGDATAGANLTSLYGDAEVRSYLDVSVLSTGHQLQSAPAQLSITVAPGEAGLVIPSGPFAIDQNGQHYKLEKVNGFQCASVYGDPQAATATTAATGTTYLQADCRGAADGLAYDIFATGISVDDVASYLQRVIAGDYSS